LAVVDEALYVSDDDPAATGAIVPLTEPVDALAPPAVTAYPVDVVLAPTDDAAIAGEAASTTRPVPAQHPTRKHFMLSRVNDPRCG
jgi:hypothetical protein